MELFLYQEEWVFKGIENTIQERGNNLITLNLKRKKFNGREKEKEKGST